jgi:chaperone BCS1
MEFRKYPFRSNKHLDKNIFFEGKREFIRYIDRFIKKVDGAPKTEHELKYEDAGITFKASIMMIGPPGCGKSSTIRGILNRTKRHGILVRWSNIKTCSEFSSLLRSTTINDIKYEPGELCFIFEDFDANYDEVLKKRSETDNSVDTNLPAEYYSFTSSDDASEDGSDETKNELKKTKKMLETVVNMHKRKDDELTLECVLNTIDGIMELHDTMMIFTTNHLEKIDPAFTRPGRIDYVLNLKNASKCVIREMVAHKYRDEIKDISMYQSYFDKMIDYVISPADVQITCLKYGEGEIEACLNELITKTVDLQPLVPPEC